MNKFLLGLATTAIAAQTFAAPDPNFHVYIAFGQSNMEGQAAVIEENKVKNDRFKVLASVTCSNMGRTLGEWAVAVPPLFHCNTGLSPADYFGKTMAENLPGITIGVIPVAVAGTSIKLFDKDQYASYLPTTESYLQQKAADYGGNPYGRIIDLAKEAQKVGVIKGILMHQGETDAYSDTWATTVKKVYTDMLSDIGLSADSVPLIVGEALQGGQCASANSQIDALPNKISTAHVVSSQGCTGGSDNLHFDNAGYQLLGKRYAEKMLSLLPSKDPVNVSSSSAAASSSSAAMASSSSQASAELSPYQGVIELPGKLEAENYDLGGQGVAYNDVNTEDVTAGLYRDDNAGVDTSAGAYFYGWTQSGEWVKYSIYANFNGEYDFKARVASGLDNTGFSLLVDGEEVASVTVPNTGDFTAFTEVEGKTSAISQGSHTLTLSVNSPYFNVDWIEFSAEGSESIWQPVKMDLSKNATYTVFSLTGQKIATFRANAQNWKQVWNSIRQKYPQGNYCIQRKLR